MTNPGQAGIYAAQRDAHAAEAVEAEMAEIAEATAKLTIAVSSLRKDVRKLRYLANRIALHGDAVSEAESARYAALVAKVEKRRAAIRELI